MLMGRMVCYGIREGKAAKEMTIAEGFKSDCRVHKIKQVKVD
jgi:hypothetical protein